MISTEKTFKFNKKTPVYKLTRGKLTGDVLFTKKRNFLQVLKVFCSCFANPFFLILASCFVGVPWKNHADWGGLVGQTR